MTREETLSAERSEARRRAEIMLAYAEGKLIQTQKRDTAYPDSWSYCSHPNWAWDSYDYRVKPEPRFVPFEVAYEFNDALVNHSSGLNLTDSTEAIYVVQRIDFAKDLIHISTSDSTEAIPYNLQGVLDNFTFMDGTKCGVTIIPTDL